MLAEPSALPGSSAAIEREAADETALMARVVARDGDAFGLLIAGHAVRLRRVAYRMLGDAGEAEDVAQEALLRLWRDAARWRPERAGPGAWLNRVTVNLCLDRLRRVRFVTGEPVPERASDAPGADTLIEADQQRAAVVGAIAALSDRQRAAIVLTYYEGLPNIMAADALELNLKAFESLLHRARQTLKAALAQAGLVEQPGLGDGR